MEGDIVSMILSILAIAGMVLAMVVPWMLFAIACVLNKSVWTEIKTIFDKTSVKIIEGKLNNRIETHLKKMESDGTISMHKNRADPSKNDTFRPKCPPHFDEKNRPVYIKKEGSPDAINLLQHGPQLTSPLEQMALSMYFEDGRKYERWANPMSKPNYQVYLLFAAVVCGLLFVAALVWTGNGMLAEILEKVTGLVV